MSDLQRQLARDTVERKQEEEAERLEDEEVPKWLKEKLKDEEVSPWGPGAWAQATKDFLDGTYLKRPPTRFPIILTPDGPIYSASQLQKLAGIKSLPKVTETAQVGVDDREIRKVNICAVVYEELRRMEDKAEIVDGLDENLTVMFQGKPRFAMVVRALKEGVSLGEENEHPPPNPSEPTEVTASPEHAESKGLTD